MKQGNCHNPGGGRVFRLRKTGSGTVSLIRKKIYRKKGKEKIWRIDAALYICCKGFCGNGKAGWNGRI